MISVTLNRCVAGVLCYVTDIPAMSGEKKATTMRLCLRKEKLGTEFSLKPVTKEVTQPDGSQVTVNSFDSYATVSTADEQTLASCDLSGYETREDGRLLYIPAMDNGEVKTKENSVLLSAYLLPLKSTATSSPENSTLVLYLDYADANGGNTESKEYKIVLGSTETERYAYSLEANRIYSIGSKPVSDEVESDRPASLEGTSIELNVMDWDAVDFATEYPQYSLDTRMVVPYNTENYIFDCINTTFTMRIIPSSNTGAWTLTSKTISTGLVQETNPMNFIYFRKAGTTDSWANQLDCSAEEAKNPMDVEVQLYDFVADRDYNSISQYPTLQEKLENDYRTANILLYEGGIEKLSLPLKQYNALIITMSDKAKSKRAFSRLDYGQTFDWNTGEHLQDAKQLQWGFWTSTPGYYPNDEDDGYKNLEEARDQAGWPSSAIQLCSKSSLGGITPADYWYLPAKNELKALLEFVVEAEGVHSMGISTDTYYHTSTGKTLNFSDHVVYISSEEVKTDYVKRTTGGNCRQARHL